MYILPVMALLKIISMTVFLIIISRHLLSEIWSSPLVQTVLHLDLSEAKTSFSWSVSSWINAAYLWLNSALMLSEDTS